MVRRNFKPHSCSLDENGPESIHRAVALTQLFSTANALSPQQRAKLAILVEEAVTNLYDHGAAVSGFVATLALVGEAGDVRLILSDSGKPFDLREADVADMPNPDRGGGMGLALIRAWADVIDYRSAGGINRLELKLRD